MTTETPYVYGHRNLGTVLRRVVGPAFRASAAGAARLVVDWDVVVGPTLAMVSTPRRLGAGMLTIACSGPTATELQHYAPELINRVNAYFGKTAVRSLHFVQTVPGVLVVTSPPRNARHCAPQALDSAATLLPDGELRAALISLGRLVLASEARRKPTMNRSASVYEG